MQLAVMQTNTFEMTNMTQLIFLKSKRKKCNELWSSHSQPLCRTFKFLEIELVRYVCTKTSSLQKALSMKDNWRKLVFRNKIDNLQNNFQMYCFRSTGQVKIFLQSSKQHQRKLAKKKQSEWTNSVRLRKYRKKLNSSVTAFVYLALPCESIDSVMA